MVAVAMCKQSSKLVFPTTFSSVYLDASSIISVLIINLSVCSFGKFLKNFFTFTGAFKSSVSVKSEYKQIINYIMDLEIIIIVFYPLLEING